MSEVRIETNPEVMLGKPVIRGTRVTVELLLRELSEGASEGPPSTPTLASRGRMCVPPWASPPKRSYP